MNKDNFVAGLILAIVVNYLGWTYAVIPMRDARLARQFQIAAEMSRPARDRAAIKMQIKKGLIKRRPSLRSLIAWEWVYKIVVFSAAPGTYIFVLLRRRTFLAIPQGKQVLALVSGGLISDTFSLWWIAPATLFYLAGLGLLIKSDATDYPAPDSDSIVKKARRWFDERATKIADDKADHALRKELGIKGEDSADSAPLKGARRNLHFIGVKIKSNLKRARPD